MVNFEWWGMSVMYGMCAPSRAGMKDGCVRLNLHLRTFMKTENIRISFFPKSEQSVNKCESHMWKVSFNDVDT